MTCPCMLIKMPSKNLSTNSRSRLVMCVVQQDSEQVAHAIVTASRCYTKMKCILMHTFCSPVTTRPIQGFSICTTQIMTLASNGCLCHPNWHNVQLFSTLLHHWTHPHLIANEWSPSLMLLEVASSISLQQSA